MREDTQDQATYDNEYLQRRNPITCEGLVQLTMGGPLPIYNGGLLQVSVRYYDAEKKRPGLPPDTAALVNKIAKTTIELTLVNTSASKIRGIIIQAGAYGEHAFTQVRYDQPGAREVVMEIDDRCFKIIMHPRTIVELSVEMDRYCNNPSYQRP